MAERTLHYANKGFRSQVVAIASDPSDPKSKRHPIIDKEVNIYQFLRGSNVQRIENLVTVRIQWEQQFVWRVTQRLLHDNTESSCDAVYNFVNFCNPEKCKTQRGKGN